MTLGKSLEKNTHTHFRAKHVLKNGSTSQSFNQYHALWVESHELVRWSRPREFLLCGKL